jgi:hypothetical protein
MPSPKSKSLRAFSNQSSIFLKLPKPSNLNGLCKDSVWKSNILKPNKLNSLKEKQPKSKIKSEKIPFPDKVKNKVKSETLFLLLSNLLRKVNILRAMKFQKNPMRNLRTRKNQLLMI